jgi:hypothetical protein
MDYKSIYSRTKNLIISPASEWKTIADEPVNGVKVLKEYALPFILLCMGGAFWGTLLLVRGFVIEKAFQIAIITFVSHFLTIFIALGIMFAMVESFGIERNRDRILTFICYALSLTFVISFTTKLLPELWFLRIGILYTAYIVWEGVTPIFGISNEDKSPFVVFTTLLLLVINFATYFLLKILLPGVN